MVHLFGHRPSEATILQASEQLYHQLAIVEHEIAARLVQSAVAHFDSPKRGVDAMEDAGSCLVINGAFQTATYRPLSSAASLQISDLIL